MFTLTYIVRGKAVSVPLPSLSVALVSVRRASIAFGVASIMGDGIYALYANGVRENA